MKKTVYIILILIVITGCSRHREISGQQYIKRQGWRSAIDQLIESFPQNKAHWGIMVQSTSGDTLYARNSDNLFVPASTLKLITAAVSWKMLGPNYRLPTYIGYDGFTNNHILFGNLVITGTGDPTFDKRHWRNPEKVFATWVDSLKFYGITEIRGDIIGNDDLFEEQRLGSGWAWDDISFPFSSEFGPLMANNSTAEITILPPEEPYCEITFIDNLPFDYFEFDNQITIIDTLNPRVHARRLPGSNTIRIFGNCNTASASINKTVTAKNPTLFYVSLLKSILEKNGIAISGNPRDIDDLEEKTENLKNIFTDYSPELRYIISQFLRDSNNQAGEALLRHLAWNEYGSGTFAEAKLIVEVVLENIGVSNLDYRFKDSCGLSRYNLISPDALNKILLYMLSEPEWTNCFSIPGKNGTLEERLIDIEAEIFAKTGSMSNINCLSGYMNTSKNDLVFSIMINNFYTPQKSSDLIDRIIKIIADNN